MTSYNVSFDWREKKSFWCIADVVTNSVVIEPRWIQSCRFLVLCDAERSMRRVRYHCCCFFFFGEGLMLPVCCAYTVTQASHGVAHRTIFSWIPRRVRTACGVIAVSQARPNLPCARCAHKSSVEGPSCKIPVTIKKKHGLKTQMLVNGHCVALETLVAATTHKRTFHQADVNLQRVFNPN